MKRRLFAIIAAVVVYLLFQFVVPVPAGLERPAIAAVGILAACIILWVAEAMPFIITVVLILIMLPVAGVIPLADVYTSFMTPVLFFCLVSFGLSAAVTMTPIPYRIANTVLKFAKTNPRKLVLGFVMCTTVLSMFVSDLAASAIFVGLALTIIKANGNPEKGKSELAKALMVGIACGAAIGGFATPIGNSLNILAITMVEQFMGIRVTFLNWCIIGIPMSLIASLITGFWCGRIFKVEAVSEEAIAEVRKQTEGFGKFSAHEWKLFIWFIIMLAFWMASTWIASINMIVVGLIGIVVAFVPGVDLLERDYYYSRIGWDVVFMIGGVQALATGIVGCGVATWFVNTALAGASSWPFIVVVLAMCVVTAFLHICIPVGPPTVSIALPLIMALAATTGVNGAVIAIIGGVLGGVTTVLPIDAIMMVAYSEGWIKMSQWVKAGWLPTVLLVILCSTYLPAMTALLGY